MNLYVTRILLHDATWSQYEGMHLALAHHEITDIIRSNDGIDFVLPPAEYTTWSINGPEDLRNHIVTVVKDVTGITPVVVVAEANCIAWCGLEVKGEKAIKRRFQQTAKFLGVQLPQHSIYS